MENKKLEVPLRTSDLPQSIIADKLTEPHGNGLEHENETRGEYTTRLGKIAHDSDCTLAQLEVDLELIEAYEEKSLEENREKLAGELEDFYKRNSWLRSSR